MTQNTDCNTCISEISSDLEDEVIFEEPVSLFCTVHYISYWERQDIKSLLHVKSYIT